MFTGDAACIRCHHGPLLTGGRFYRLGVEFRDEGLFSVTGKPDDKYKFRAPPLRGMGRTAPCMHDGSLATLEQVVEFYFRGVPSSAPDGLQLHIQPLRTIRFNDLPDLLEFVKSLDGEPPP